MVALLMAEPVVHGLEAVEVADYYRQRPASAAGPLQLEREQLLERAPVEQPGERVGAGRVGQPEDELLHPVPHVGDQHAGDGRDPYGREPALVRLDRGDHVEHAAVGAAYEHQHQRRLPPDEEVEGEHAEPDVVEPRGAGAAPVEVDGGGDEEDAAHQGNRDRRRRQALGAEEQCCPRGEGDHDHRREAGHVRVGMARHEQRGQAEGGAGDEEVAEGPVRAHPVEGAVHIPFIGTSTGLC
jgi:hypothetical protein